MAHVNLPSTLSVAQWEKLKAPKTPATKLPDELKQLTKLHLALKWDDFDAARLKTADDIEAGQDKLRAAEKAAIKALRSQAETVAAAAADYETKAKADKSVPKDLVAAANAIAKAARLYAAEVAEAVDAARQALQDKAGKLQADKGDEVDPKQLQQLKAKLLAAMATVRKQQSPRPMRFLIVRGKVNAALALAYAVGTAQEKQLKACLPNEAPYKVIKDKTAEVIWEQKAVTLVSDRVPAGLLKKVQLWMKKTLKLNVRLRLRASSGEVEETQGEDLSESDLKTATEQARQSITKQAVAARLAGLQAGIQAAVQAAKAAPAKSEIPALVTQVAKLVGAGSLGEADELIDEIEVLLEGDGHEADNDSETDNEADEVETTEDAPARPAAKAAPGDDETRAAFTRRVGALQARIKQALAGASAARVKPLSDGVTQAAKVGRYADANRLLDALEPLLDQGSKAGGGEAARAQALEAWKTRRAAAVSSLKAVATQVAAAKHASSAKAVIELQAVIKNLTPEPASLQQVKDLQRWLADDDVVTDVCELAEDIRTPLLGALDQLHDAIAA
jgi:hypothetical protein